MPGPARRAGTISLTGATGPISGSARAPTAGAAASATQRHRKPENWLAALARNGHGLAEETALEPGATRRLEALLMGLRLREGVELDAVAAALDLGAVERLEGQGLLIAERRRRLIVHARRAGCCSTPSWPRSPRSRERLVEAPRRRRDGDGARRR